MKDKDELRFEINALLRCLRSCDTQATAISWMTRAFKAMEQCIEQLDKPEPNVRERLVFVPSPPVLKIVQDMPTAIDAKYLQARRTELQIRSVNTTVVYPEVFLPAGLKPLPKPWTREDTRRLQREATFAPVSIQRRGR